jgi:hypothetical protein
VDVENVDLAERQPSAAAGVVDNTIEHAAFRFGLVHQQILKT